MAGLKAKRYIYDNQSDHSSAQDKVDETSLGYGLDTKIDRSKLAKFLYQSDHFIVNKSKFFEVSVSPNFIRSQSLSEQKMWIYFIIVTNFGNQPYKLISRKLLIKDGYKPIQEISGTGAVGLNPIIDPSSSFEYCSHIMVDSNESLMQISFLMQNTITSQNIIIESKDIILADFDKIIHH